MKKSLLILSMLAAGFHYLTAQVEELWGLTSSGGDTLGNIFKINSDGTGFANVHTFEYYSGRNNYDRDFPALLNVNGKLYGTNRDGGNHHKGTFYVFDTATNVLTKLFDFDDDGFFKGAYPGGALSLGPDGKIYGVCSGGGAYNMGVIFSYDITTSVYTDLVDLNGTFSGGTPTWGVQFAPNGKLYGVCLQGGTTDEGTLFSYDPATFTFAKIINFGNSTYGCYPYCKLALGPNGKLYGASTGNCANDARGKLFALDPSTNAITIVKDFDYDGSSNPSGKLLSMLYPASDGKIYTVTRFGGANNMGTILSVDPATNVVTKLYDMSSSVHLGSPAEGPPGKLYACGMGGSSNKGVIYEFDYTTNTLTPIHNLTTATGESWGYTGFPLFFGNTFYGITETGGTDGYGVIYKCDTSGNYTDVYHFQSYPDGAHPQGALIKASNGKVYGTTRFGGRWKSGSAFVFNTCSNTFTKIHDFNDTTGEEPRGNVIEASNGKIYGTCYKDGIYNSGVLWSIDTATNVVSMEFSFPTGNYPMPCILQHTNGLIYGTGGPGLSFADYIYSFDPVTLAYTSLQTLNSTTGYNPVTPLLKGSNGKLYGATSSGGVNSSGTIYSYDPATSTFTKLYDMTSAGGYNVIGKMVQAASGIIYGVANSGGANSRGTIFSFNPSTNTFTKLFDFSGLNGENPEGGLYLASNGNLCGTTRGGGVYGVGVLFNYNIAASTFTKVKDFNTVDGGNCKAELMPVNAGISAIAASSISCPGSPVVLSASGANSYTWQPGGMTGASIIVNPTASTTYTVTGVTSSGCLKTGGVTVDVMTANAGSDVYLCSGTTATMLLATPENITTGSNYDFDWAFNNGSANNDDGWAVVTDQAGNVYQAGYFKGTVTFGTYTLTSNNNSNDIFVVKRDSAGTVLWAKSGGGPSTSYSDGPRDLAVASNGDLYLCGTLTGTGTLGGLSYSSDNNGQAFIAKFNSAGTFSWIRLVGAFTGTDLGEAIDVDKFTGDVYMTGMYYGTGTFGTSTITSNFLDYFLVKYNSAGVFQWVRTATGSSGVEWGRGVSVDLNGNVYVAGEASGTLTFGSITSTFNGPDVFVAKYDKNGNEQWVKGGGSTTGGDMAYDVVSDYKGDVYVTGYFAGTATFGTTTLTSAGDDDLFYAKYSSGGNLLWIKQAGGTGKDRGMRIAISPQGDKILQDTWVANGCNFGQGYVVSNPFASQTTALIISDTLGNYLWETDDFSVGVYTYESCFDPSGGIIYSTGYFANSSNVAQFNLVPVGGTGEDAMIYRNSLPTLLTYNWSPSTGLNFSNIPNPISTPSGTTSYTVTISSGSCSVTDVVSVSSVAAVSAGPDAGFCIGGSTVLNATGGGQTYTWAPPTGLSATNIANPVAYPASTTTYTVTSTSGNCTSNDLVVVTVNALPAVTLNLSSIDTLCLNSSSVTLTGSPSGGTYSGTGVSGSQFNPSASGTGNFQIIYSYTDGNGCSSGDTSSIYVDACTSVEKTELERFSVYPNPTAGKFFVSSEETIQVTLYSITGEVVLAQKILPGTTAVDISELANGVYFLEIRTDRDLVTKRLIRN